MRIAVLTNVIPSPNVTGGAERVAYMYNEFLRDRGHEIRVWGPNSAFEKLGRMNPISRLVFHLMELGSNDVTAREIIEWKPDILLTHNLTGCGFGTPKLMARQGIRWAHFLHDPQLIEPSGRMFSHDSCARRFVWRRIWSALHYLTMGDPAIVISPTTWLLHLHESFGWFRDSKKRIIPNPLDVSFIHFATPDVARDSRQVLFVGRLDKSKGIDLLIDAWPEVQSTASRLVIVGDGELRQDIEVRNLRGVEVRGPQNSSEVSHVMRQSGIVVVPSRVMENQPTVILEAVASGCRVVATDVGGVRETLDGVGWIVEAQSVSALVFGIRNALMTAPDPRREEARDRFLRRHDVNVVGGQILEVLLHV